MIWLSQYKEIDDTGCGYNLISNNKFFSYSASLPTFAKVINSDFTIEWVIQVCFFDAQETELPPIVDTQPKIDLLSLILFIQLAFVLP